eukprot:Hpha_TRINITY_DN16858_c3_g11::TRINITY_DN16858_c3_g11_i2::g.148468::m.148468
MEPVSQVSLAQVANALHNQVESDRLTARITHDEQIELFECSIEPQIKIRTFLYHVRHLARPHEWLNAMILVTRLLSKLGHKLSIYNVHRLIITAAVISVKMHRGVSGVNRVFARTIAMELSEIGAMERVFLELIDWSVHVTPCEFVNASKCIR